VVAGECSSLNPTSCDIRTEAECNSSLGRVLGWDPEITTQPVNCQTACPCEPSTGACCDTRYGSCTNNITRADCSQWYHVWSADVQCVDAQCVQRGTCCTVSGETVVCNDNRTLSQCNAAGGVWRPGLRCSDPAACTDLPGSCCLPSGICRDSAGTGGEPSITPVECVNLGGQWQNYAMCSTRNCGDGPYGACCVPGNCYQATQSQCAVGNGVWTQGASCSDEGLCEEPCGCTYDCLYNSALNSWSWELVDSSRCGEGDCEGTCEYPESPCIAGTQSVNTLCVRSPD
jgi:hypothetical protein